MTCPGEGYAGMTISVKWPLPISWVRLARFSGPTHWTTYPRRGAQAPRSWDQLVQGHGQPGDQRRGRPEGGRNNGGHAYMIYGLCRRGGCSCARIPGGEWFGIQGMFVMNFDDMERLLMDKGDACFFDEVVT